MDKSNSNTEKKALARLHCLVWAAIMLISFFGMISSDGVGLSAAYTIVNAFLYALIIYGNISFLYPRLYQKRRYVLYVLGSALLVVVAGAGKMLFSNFIRENDLLPPDRLLRIENFPTLDRKSVV